MAILLARARDVFNVLRPQPTFSHAYTWNGGLSSRRRIAASVWSRAHSTVRAGAFHPVSFSPPPYPVWGLYGKRLPVHDSNIHFFLTPLYSRFCQVTSNKLLQNTTASGQLYALLKAARLTAHDADGTVAQNRYSPVFDKLPCSSRALRGFMRQPKALRSPPATVS